MRVRTSLAAALTAALLMTPNGGAARANMITWNPYSSNSLSPLDTQGTPDQPVYNSTGCVWNDQDEITDLGRGDISAAASDTLCLVADYDDTHADTYPKLIIFQVYAPSDTLTVTLSSDAGDAWQSPSSVPWGNQRLWQLCVADPVADAANVSNAAGLDYWPIIAGSGGGRGQIVHYTLNIASPGRVTHKAVAYFEIGPNGTSYPRTLRSTSCPPSDGQ